MRERVIVVVVILFALSATAIAQSAESSTTLGVLGRYLGTWASHTIIKRSAWFPAGEERLETTTVKEVLNSHFLKGTSVSDQQETWMFLRYTEESNTYQEWTFDSNGSTGYWVGTWDEGAQTMTWGMDLGFLRGVMIDRFGAEDKYESQIIIVDSKGKLLLDVESQSIRSKQ